MDYDVLILGGGLSGCAIAYELSKYSLNIALIEKDYDIADDISLVNTAMIYDGIENEYDLMARLEKEGNKDFDSLTSKFKVPFKRIGTLMLARDIQHQEILKEMYERAIKRKIEDMAFLSSKYIKQIEPNLNMGFVGGIYTKNTGVVCPYDLAIAYGEVAFDNGVKFKLEEEVIDIEKISKGYRVITNKNKFKCKIVINTTPGENYSIDVDKKVYPKKSIGNVKYLLLDKNFKRDLEHILVLTNENDEKIMVIPTLQDSTIISMYSKENISYDYFINGINKIFPDIDNKHIRNFYQGQSYESNIVIDDSSIDEGYIKVDGKNYSEVTMTPFIARMICETVVNNLNCKLNKDFNDKRREFYKFRDLSDEEIEQVVIMNEKYGKIICHCQKVTEGEIIDSIRRPLGARTLEGIKRRTGAAYGGCQGANCINKIISILARETNKNFTDIVKDSKDSKVVLGRIKEFDEV